MNNLTKKLFTDFPLIYNHNKSKIWAISQFGVECGNGWHDLIYNLSKEINNIVCQWPIQKQKNFYIQQIKEKFGTLRCYSSIYDKKIEELISKAEDKSAKTCEYCGKPGEPRNTGWIKTLCDACLANWPRKI